MAMFLELQQCSGASESRAEHMQYFMDLGLDRETAALLYRGERLQERGQLRQALPYFQEVHAAFPDCREASVSVRMITKMLLKDVSAKEEIETRQATERRTTRKRPGRRERHALRCSATIAPQSQAPYTATQRCLPPPVVSGVAVASAATVAAAAAAELPAQAEQAVLAAALQPSSRASLEGAEHAPLGLEDLLAVGESSSSCQKHKQQDQSSRSGRASKPLHELARLRAIHRATGGHVAMQRDSEVVQEQPQQAVLAEQRGSRKVHNPALQLPLPLPLAAEPPSSSGSGSGSGSGRGSGNGSGLPYDDEGHNGFNALRCTLGAALGRSNVPFRDWAQLVMNQQDTAASPASSSPLAVAEESCWTSNESPG